MNSQTNDEGFIYELIKRQETLDQLHILKNNKMKHSNGSNQNYPIDPLIYKPQREDPFDEKYCYNCGEPEHISRKCRRKNFSYKENNTCFYCDEMGHQQRNCPKRVIEQNLLSALIMFKKEIDPIINSSEPLETEYKDKSMKVEFKPKEIDPYIRIGGGIYHNKSDKRRIEQFWISKKDPPAKMQKVSLTRDLLPKGDEDLKEVLCYVCGKIGHINCNLNNLPKKGSRKIDDIYEKQEIQDEVFEQNDLRRITGKHQERIYDILAKEPLFNYQKEYDHEISEQSLEKVIMTFKEKINEDKQS